MLQPAGNESRDYTGLEKQAVCKIYNQFETSYLYIPALHANCLSATYDHSPSLAASMIHLSISRLGFPVWPWAQTPDGKLTELQCMHNEILPISTCHPILLQVHSSSAFYHGMTLALLIAARRCCCISHNTALHLRCSWCRSAVQHKSPDSVVGLCMTSAIPREMAILACWNFAEEHG